MEVERKMSGQTKDTDNTWDWLVGPCVGWAVLKV